MQSYDAGSIAVEQSEQETNSNFERITIDGSDESFDDDLKGTHFSYFV